jgi:uncharacterized protein YkwD
MNMKRLLLLILMLITMPILAQPDTLPPDVELVDSLNHYRTDLEAITLNSQLNEAANQYAQQMAEAESLNVSVDIAELLEDVGYRTWQGVNLVAASGQDFPPSDVADMLWENYQDTLSREEWTVAGVGISESSSGTTYYLVILVHPIVCDPGIVEEEQENQAEAILEQVNDLREAQGLETLTLDTELSEAAAVHSDDMASGDFLAHEGSNSSTPAERVTAAGYEWMTVGENVLYRFDVDAEGAFEQWLTSPPHYENMVTPDFTEIGLAFTCSTDSGRYYYAMVLAAPR